MSTQTLIIKLDGATKKLVLMNPVPDPSPEFVEFINGSDGKCGIWFENDATFGVRSFSLDNGQMRRLLYGGQTTKYALFELPLKRCDTGPETVPIPVP